MTDYLRRPNGQIVRRTPKIKGKAAVKAHRKAKRKAWRDLQAAKRFALAFPESDAARQLAELEAQFGVRVKV